MNRVRGRLRLASWTCVALAVVALTPASRGQDACDTPGEYADIVTSAIYDVGSYGSLGGISAFAFGSTACNVGLCRVLWIGSDSNHPVIAQNMFRLKNGRLEQVGQGWLKHGFGADQVPCGSCVPDDFSHLGVGCSDTYIAAQAGAQHGVGSKAEVDAHYGTFPYPPSNFNQTGDTIYKRVQVHNVDLEPTLNPGAQYFAEVQYVAPDDAGWHKGDNNATWQPLIVSPSGSSFVISLTGMVHVGDPAIRAWKFLDPSVVETTIHVPVEGTFFLSAKATDLGGGTWHYEYALQNLNSHRSAQSFTVPIPPGTIVTNVGFHDVDYHSGDPYVGTDWTATIGAGAVVWSSQTYAQNLNANALRWGTLYNFRFDANVPPETQPITIGLFRPGTPASVSANTIAPNVCDHDGICDPNEILCACLSDCTPPAESCFNDQDDDCDGQADCADPDCHIPGSTETLCFNGEDDDCDGLLDCADTDCPGASEACFNGRDDDCDGLQDCADPDCRPPGATESVCTNGIDDDCDGRADCTDGDCCAAPACASGPDSDGDSFRVPCDCNDGNATIYPGAPQACDGVNNNCSDPSWPAVPAGEQDPDLDGHPACGDCNESNPEVWATPSEVPFLIVLGKPNTALFWTIPTGSQTFLYDAVRSSSTGDFLTDATCLPMPDPTDRQANDGEEPPAGGIFKYLVRARNTCPAGEGPWGIDSGGQPIAVRPCP